ncbi:MAG: hypothetical protein HKN82_20160 [Akkermansiaceae bacterium]|nr:hypothetical protein [Akkermansiaceae bacterium]NNM28998.1 hypothetical protein [Akkermansiaceae bacterium]
MKALALLPIAGAFSLYGSAFFGIWTAPGLENLPTCDVVMEHAPWNTEAEPEPVTGIIPISSVHQFQPVGVTSDWGNQPVIVLPTPDPEKIHVQALPKPAPVAAARPHSRPQARAAIRPQASPASKAAASRAVSQTRSYQPRGTKTTNSYRGSSSGNATRQSSGGSRPRVARRTYRSRI